MDNTVDNIIKKFPENIRVYFHHLETKRLCEIRFRVGRKAYLYYGTEQGVKAFDKIFSKEDIADVFAVLCNNSVYAYKEEIANGFITLSGGHRVGICGRAVLSGGIITNICDISGINIRIAREFKGCADEIMPYIAEDGRVRNVLIIGAPGSGKTTLLRECARKLSNRYKVSVIDERSEIAALDHGMPQFDIGNQTDIFDAFPKDKGMITALRAMSPNVIITDEVGTENDLDAVKYVLNGGASVISTIHGSSYSEIKKTKKDFISVFDRAIVVKRKGEKLFFEKYETGDSE